MAHFIIWCLVALRGITPCHQVYTPGCVFGYELCYTSEPAMMNTVR